MHAEAFAFVERTLSSIPPRGRVVELGSRNINGSVRPWFASAEDYTGVDLVEGPGVDVVADAALYEPDRPPDVVVCCEVLEHSPIANDIVANAAHMLAPGGWLLVTCATDPRAPHSAVDGSGVRDGEYYGNVPPASLWDWARGAGLELVQREVDFAHGDLRLLARKL